MFLKVFGIFVDYMDCWGMRPQLCKQQQVSLLSIVRKGQEPQMAILFYPPHCYAGAHLPQSLFVFGFNLSGKTCLDTPLSVSETRSTLLADQLLSWCILPAKVRKQQPTKCPVIYPPVQIKPQWTQSSLLCTQGRSHLDNSLCSTTTGSEFKQNSSGPNQPSCVNGCCANVMNSIYDCKRRHCVTPYTSLYYKELSLPFCQTNYPSLISQQ